MPTWLNMKDTAPVSARLPPFLEKMARTSPAVRFAIVGQSLDDDRHAAGTVTLVADFVVAFRVGALRLLDGTVDIVLRHVLGARRKDRRTQARIECRIRETELGRDGDFTRELAEQLGARLILAPLAVHDVLELGMTCHRKTRRLCRDAGGYIGRSPEENKYI
jgi:hypothetical protein